MSGPLEEAVLVGRSVRLEPMRLEHAPALAEVGLEPGLWQWTLFAVRTADEMEQWVRTALDEQSRGVSLPWVIVERAGGRIVGSTRYLNIVTAHRRVEIGWTWVAPAWQRSAVNTECKFLLLQHAFEGLDLVRVELKTDALNTTSRRAIEGIGGVFEGIFRRHLVTQSGRWRDTAWYSIIAEEWPAVRDRLKARMAKYGPPAIGPDGRVVDGPGVAKAGV